VNNRQLAQVGLGLLGVWAVLSAVAAFIQIAGVVGVSLPRLGFAEVVPVGLLLGLSYLLIFHNASVATAIFPSVDAADQHTPPDFARTLIALTGVILLVQAAPSAVNTVLILLSVSEIDPPQRAELLRRLIGILVPIGSGIYLMTRPGRLLEYWQRASPEHIPSGE
jgi:hypothetical protein